MFRPSPGLCCSSLYCSLGFIGIARLQRCSARCFEAEQYPGSASLDANGISSTNSAGAPSFVPWSAFSGWKEGKDVFTLTKGKSFNVVTKRGLNDADVEQLRSLFRSQIH